VVLPLLRRYFLISRRFGYFVGPVLFASPSLRAKIEKPIHEHHREFFTEGSEENKDSYLRLIPNPLRYLRFLLFSFSFSRGRPESDARTLRTPKALRAKIGKPIPLSRPGESSAFVPQSREFGVTG
jgi:hypothetical protein